MNPPDVNVDILSIRGANPADGIWEAVLDVEDVFGYQIALCYTRNQCTFSSCTYLQYVLDLSPTQVTDCRTT